VADAEKETNMRLRINCDCGVLVLGADEDELVTNAIAHAKDAHSMTITREQALALAESA
jgi:predicted small metal-binding protein